MKKIIVIIICITLLALAFGCGEQNVAGGPSFSPETEATPPATEAPEVELPEGGEDDPEEEEEITVSTKSYAVSTANGLRVRSSASQSGAVLGVLDREDAVLITGKSGDYYRTVFREREAYVHSSYVKVLEFETAGEDVERAIDVGSSLLGYPYVWGSQRYHWGNGRLNANYVRGEYDCSALVLYVYYASNGVVLSLTSREQVQNGVAVEREDLRRGDLMFFTNDSRASKTGTERIGHVGIYLGNNYILHTASDHAVIEPISAKRWSYYITARRVVD